MEHLEGPLGSAIVNFVVSLVATFLGFFLAWLLAKRQISASLEHVRLELRAVPRQAAARELAVGLLRLVEGPISFASPKPSIGELAAVVVEMKQLMKTAEIHFEVPPTLDALVEELDRTQAVLAVELKSVDPIEATSVAAEFTEWIMADIDQAARKLAQWEGLGDPPAPKLKTSRSSWTNLGPPRFPMPTRDTDLSKADSLIDMHMGWKRWESSLREAVKDSLSRRQRSLTFIDPKYIPARPLTLDDLAEQLAPRPQDDDGR